MNPFFLYNNVLYNGNTSPRCLPCLLNNLWLSSLHRFSCWKSPR